jgi:hypothetical protein
MTKEKGYYQCGADEKASRITSEWMMNIHCGVETVRTRRTIRMHADGDVRSR